MAKKSAHGTGPSTAKAAPRQTAKLAPAAPMPKTSDTSALSLKQLAEGIIARTVKPRVADIRRLAEGVLAAAQSKRKDGKKDGSKKGKGKKAMRKLAKIPGQKNKA